MSRIAFVLAAALLPATGCVLDRTIVRVEEQPDKKVSLIETVDQYPFASTRQFWLCTDDQTTTTCLRSCGGYSDLTCHTLALGTSNLR